MGVRTASSRSTRTASTRSGSVAVVGDPTTDNTNDYILTGSGASNSAVFTELISSANTATSITSVLADGTPIISNVAYTDSSYNILAGNTAVGTGGGYISIFGSSFQSNSNVYISGTLVSNTLVGTTRINVPVTLATVGNYNIMVSNAVNLSGLLPGVLKVVQAPIWTTYNINTIFSLINNQLAATDATTYALTGGSLPDGVSLSSTGLLSGVLSNTTPQTYSFTVTAYNADGLYTSQAVSITLGNQYTITYLAVAGGGSGGTAGIGGYAGGGGGGAGGVIATSGSIFTSNSYVIGIGGGAASFAAPPAGSTVGSPGFTGGNTYISGPGLGNVTAVGGGAGASLLTPPSSTSAGGFGGDGGSGGGGGGGSASPTVPPGGAGGTQFHSPAPPATFYTSPGQQGYAGQPGGTGTSSSVQGGGGGGGGGAGGLGTKGGDNVAPLLQVGGNGGPGYFWPVLGVTFGGGGGGGAGGSGGVPNANGGTGGPGGGGSGSSRPSTVPYVVGGSGTAGLGGGGGGQTAGGQPGPSVTTYVAGAGGSGNVIITYPSPGVQIGSGGSVSTRGSGPTLIYVHTFTTSGTFLSTTTPTWVTAGNQRITSGTPFSIALSATDVNTVTYALTSGNTLPSGVTLTNGVLAGTITTNQSLLIDAVNVTGGKTTQQFNLWVNYPATYVVVGGGGGGGGASYAGSAGGGGGGQYSPGSGTLLINTTYPVTIGAGGSPGPGTGGTNGPYGPGGTGGTTTFNSLSSSGGGGGGGVGTVNNPGPSVSDPGVGGSSSGGGGGASGGAPGLGARPPVPVSSSGAGGGGGTYPGGAGAPLLFNPVTPTPQGWIGGGGGGGGAGGAGGGGSTGQSGPTGSYVTNPAPGGAGGAGLSVPFTGNIVAGGGGGAASRGSSGVPGSPGPSTGGGGVGGTGAGGGGAAGADGTVFLAVPTALYSGTYTGTVIAYTPPLAPGQTILRFNSSGTYTA